MKSPNSVVIRVNIRHLSLSLRFAYLFVRFSFFLHAARIWSIFDFANFFLAKVRRLYDIANVLSTINLITKVTDPSYRGPRPAFQYIGPRTEIIHHAESKYLELTGNGRRFVSLFHEDVVDFINSENTKSNSKHSLFDHFKRNLFLNCTIPRFDPRNGLLGLKSALDMSGRSSSGVTVTGVYSNSISGGTGGGNIKSSNSYCITCFISDDDLQHTISVENSTSNSYISESSKLRSR